MDRRVLLCLATLMVAAACAPEDSAGSGVDGPHIDSAEAVGLPLAATVLGQEIRTSDPAEIQQAILTRLFDQYANERGIAATEPEVAAFVENMRRAMAADDNLDAEQDLTAEESEQVAVMRRAMARSIIRQWKLNRALYGQYGGRIIYQQLGPEPLDAYRQFLEQRLADGAFVIHDAVLADAFWRYFKDESIHDFMDPDSADAAKAFSVPPWQRFDSTADA